MRILSDPVLEALRSGRYGVRTLVKLAPDGAAPLCVWNDAGDVSYAGDTYQGFVGRFQVTLPESTADLSVRGATIEFAATDNAVVAIIESVNWSQRPGRIMQAVFAIDTPQTLIVNTVFSGFMDRIEWTEQADGSPARLVVSLESTAREFSLSGARTASDADQRDRDANDGFFAFASTAVSTTIDWGRAPQASQKQPKSGLSAFIDKIF